VEGIAEALRAFGGSEEQVQQWQAQHEPPEIEVWECNLLTVQLYLGCTLTWISGIGGAVCLGLSMQEIAAALDAYAVPAEQRAEVAAGLVLMGRVAARCLNGR
jgi:hypothetical protein